MNWGDERLPDRFWDKTIPEPNSGCWLWTGKLNNQGYGQFSVRRKHQLAHRVSKDAVGGLVVGLVSDHLCKNKLCCNPSHIEMVTQAENVRRDPSWSTKQICKQGHPLPARRSSARQRLCRICANKSNREHKLRKKQNRAS